MVTYPRIKFECEINGKELIAEVIAEEVNPGHFNFNTRFSDGFEDTFIHEERSGLWEATRDKKSAYLKKVKDDLSALVAYQIDRPYLSFRHKIDAQVVNVWVFETQWEDRSMIYTVYYKGDYQFEMKKICGGWYAKTVRPKKDTIIDEGLVAKIGERIDNRFRV
jgi:hypothetical protein